MTQGQRLADIVERTKRDGYFLPARARARADCKVLVKQGQLEPNGCLGYRIPSDLCIDPTDTLLVDETSPDGVRHITVRFGTPVIRNTQTLDLEIGA